MANFKAKMYRLEAVETAYNAVKATANDIITKWERVDTIDGGHDWTQRTLSTDELEDDEKARYKAYEDFLRELDKLA